MKVAVTGANGQLGCCLRNILNDEVVFLSKEEMDITNEYETLDVIRDMEIDLVINTAAYTHVDRAETEKDLCWSVNEKGVRNLSQALERRNGKLIHISTDYVFDGLKKEPYVEENETNPLSEYGLSKRGGERVLLHSNINGVILRTSWLFSPFGKNFVKTMVQLMSQNDEIRVVQDQIGSPTSALDLSKSIETLISTKFPEKTEIYHFANSGYCSWWDFATEIKNNLKLSTVIVPITTDELHQTAKRPAFGALSSKKFENDYSFKIQSWQSSLKNVLKEIK